MALLFMDGFEHYANGDMAEKWSTVDTQNISSTYARTGTYSLGTTGGNTVILPATDATFIAGIGFRASGWGGYIGPQLAGTSQVTLQLQSDGAIYVKRGSTVGTVIAQSSPGVFQFSTWNYLEFKLVIHNSTGTVLVKVNGGTVINASGLDTQNDSSSSLWTGLLLGGGNVYWDDLYCCDGSGSNNNDLLGECRVVTLMPSTGNGSNTDFTCSSSTDHGALVDEKPPNDDTDYVYSSTLNHVDSWNYPALGYTGTIKGVQMSLSARKTDSGTRAIAAVTRPASTNRVHATDHYLGTSYAYWRAIWELNPEDSAAWEVADVDGAEFGVKVTV